MDQLALQVFNEQNKIRQNPKSYIGNLERMLGFFKGNTLYLPGQIPLQTNEGPSAVRDCMNFLNRQQSLEPLKLNDQMSKAAQDHANDIGPKGITGHNGSDGSTMTSRLEKYGDWMGKIGENICFGGNTAVDIIVQLIIDDGVSNRGHRMNIFGKDYKVTGIAAAKHSQYDICCVLDYASEYTSKGEQKANTNANQSFQNPYSFGNIGINTQQKPSQQQFYQQQPNQQQFIQQQPNYMYQQPQSQKQNQFQQQPQFQQQKQEINVNYNQPQFSDQNNYQKSQQQQGYQYQQFQNFNNIQQRGDLGLQFQDQLKDFDNFFKKDPQVNTNVNFQTYSSTQNNPPQQQFYNNQKQQFYNNQQYQQQDQFTGNNQKPPGTVKTSTEKKINIVNGVRTVTETITYTLANGEVKVVEKVYQQ